MNSVGDKHEYKGISSSIFIILILAMVVNWFFTNYRYQEMAEKMLKRDYVLLGSIVEKYPESEKLVMDCLKDKGSEINIEYGKVITSRRTYIDEHSAGFVNYTKIFYNQKSQIDIYTALIFLAILIFMLRKNFNSIYGRIATLSVAADKIMAGDFSHRVSEEGEGYISRLSHQFDQMSNRLKYTMEQLNEEKNYLRDIVSDISHQLKTPLSSIKMFNEFLIEGIDGDEKNRFLKETQQQIEKMEWMIKALLKISRLKSETIEFNYVEYNLCDTIRSLIETLEEKAESKKQRIRFDKNSERLMMRYDKEWLFEGIKNIVENALEYSSDNSEVHIVLNDCESHIKLEVIDSGIGISEEELPKIFDRFYSGKNNLEISKKGNGVGLSLTKLIVERHNGSIGVSSEKGKGTVFTLVFLP